MENKEIERIEYLAAIILQGIISDRKNFQYPNGYGDRTANEIMVSTAIKLAYDLREQVRGAKDVKTYT